MYSFRFEPPRFQPNLTFQKGWVAVPALSFSHYFIHAFVWHLSRCLIPGHHTGLCRSQNEKDPQWRRWICKQITATGSDDCRQRGTRRTAWSPCLKESEKFPQGDDIWAWSCNGAPGQREGRKGFEVKKISACKCRGNMVNIWWYKVGSSNSRIIHTHIQSCTTSRRFSQQWDCKYGCGPIRLIPYSLGA